MIKNSNQFKNAKDRILYIEGKIEEYRNKYKGIELSMYIMPLMREQAELESQINEYSKLTTLPFEEAVIEFIDGPILIDNIGELLSKLRIAAKLTQTQMADRLNWTQSNLSRFEGENYSSQSISKIVEYASALGVYLHVIPSLSDNLMPKVQIKNKPKIEGFILTSGGVSTDTSGSYTKSTDISNESADFDVSISTLSSKKNLLISV